LLTVGEKCTLYGVLDPIIRIDKNARPARVSIKICDLLGHYVSATFFGDHRVVQNQLNGREGSLICLAGTVEIFDNKLQLKSPSIINDALIGSIAPIYHGKPKVISSETVGKYMSTLLPTQHRKKQKSSR
jgi:hypothetical protein